MDFEAIKKAAQAYGPDMTRFLRDMIAIPSESCEEEGVAKRIEQEMKKLGYDKVEIDGLGNVIGWMGDGEKIIAIDSHIAGRTTPRSTAAAAPIRRAASPPPCTAPRS